LAKASGGMRALAEIMVRPNPKATVLRIAQDYDRLAEEAKERMSRGFSESLSQSADPRATEARRWSGNRPGDPPIDRDAPGA
jgi:hypothetical protein